MNVALLKPFATNHIQLRERLKAEFALVDGDDVLTDTLDGISDFKELCIATARQIREREAMAMALDSMIAAMKQRRERFQIGADKMRDVLAEAMIDAGEKAIVAPDLTLSARMGKPAPRVTDADKLPDEFVRVLVSRKPNMAAIKDAVNSGNVPDGVAIDNPEPVFMLRSK